MSSSSKLLFKRRTKRNRYALKKVSKGKLRLSVFRSSKHIYGQVIDDNDGHTLVSASSLNKDKSVLKKGSNIDAAKVIGSLLAEKALKEGISEVVFDRGGYKYHGRVKALADAAREKGLKF